MTFLLLKYLHIASMFMGTAFAVGPAVLFFLVARSSDAAAVRGVFGLAKPVFRASTAFYGLGVVFGFAAALSGAIDLTSGWLLIAYFFVAAIGGNAIYFDGWARRVERHLEREDAAGASRLLRARGPFNSLVAMVVLTLAIVYVMVAKPAPF
jgi:uncharacterized membrane protein